MSHRGHRGDSCGNYWGVLMCYRGPCSEASFPCPLCSDRPDLKFSDWRYEDDDEFGRWVRKVRKDSIAAK